MAEAKSLSMEMAVPLQEYTNHCGRVHCLSLEQLARKYAAQMAVPPAPHLVDAKELVEMELVAG